jgi:hypothetical protein
MKVKDKVKFFRENRFKAMHQLANKAELGIFEEIQKVIDGLESITAELTPHTFPYDEICKQILVLQGLLPRLLGSANRALEICDNLVWEPWDVTKLTTETIKKEV